MTTADVLVRRARTSDVPDILALINPLVEQNILLGKQRVQLYESVQEFVVAVSDGTVVGCGALHPMWFDLGEVRTIAVADPLRGQGAKQPPRLLLVLGSATPVEEHVSEAACASALVARFLSLVLEKFHF
jgi:N-acetylglutamate synthase-like GNAT family acetyltransferase